MPPSLSALGVLALSAGVAGADTFTVLEGRLTDAATGKARPLSGELELSLLEPDESADPTDVLFADDFELRAGRRVLTPAGLVEYEGLHPVFPYIADQIQLDGNAVAMVWLRAGGELVAESEQEVTFRFFELRSDGAGGGRASGGGNGALPRRLRLEGTLVQVDQTFRLPEPDDCLAPPQPLPTPLPTPHPGGGVILSGNTIVDYQSFDIAAGETVLFERPTGGGAVLNRVTGSGPSQIEGSLHSGGSVVMLNPAGVNLSTAGAVLTSNRLVMSVGAPMEPYTSSFAAVPMSVSAGSDPAPVVPTLEQLGMRAPQGAQVTLDAGALRVETAGDLFIEGVFPEIPGLVSVTLIAGGDVRVADTASLHVSAGVSISIWAGGSYQGPLPGPGPIPSPLPPPVAIPGFCRGMRAVVPASERVIGHFSLVASTAQQVRIDVEPGDARNRVQPGARKPIAVALFGSRALDVRDVDPGSLRLGPGGAEPLRRFGRPQIFRLRWNRDRYLDLVAFFAPYEAEIAFGDTELCLAAETDEGIALEGCDAIETRQAPLRGGIRD